MKLRKFTAWLIAALTVTVLSGCANNSSKTESLAEVYENSDASSKLHRAVYDFDFSIDGDNYSVPMSYWEWQLKGWNYESGEDEKIGAHVYGSSMKIKKDDLWMSVQPMNNTDSEISLSDAYIGEVVLDMDSQKADVHEIKYVDIVLGKSTMDDVKAAFGEPTSVSESDDYPEFIYEYGTYVNVKFHFDVKKGNIVDKILLNNLDRYCYGG